MGETLSLRLWSWGDGITDIRGMGANIGSPCGASKETALDALRAILEKAPPGIVLASNPHYGYYAKWSAVLWKAGFKQVGGCAINRVYVPRRCEAERLVADRDKAKRFTHWVHIFYLVKPGASKLKFSFDKRKTPQDSYGGDNDDALFHVNYYGIDGIDSYPARYEPTYARLSRNCGCAFGYGLPTKYSTELDDRYFTVAGLELRERFPKGWRKFAQVGNLKFGHNLGKLWSAQKCPHDFAEIWKAI